MPVTLVDIYVCHPDGTEKLLIGGILSMDAFIFITGFYCGKHAVNTDEVTSNTESLADGNDRVRMTDIYSNSMDFIVKKHPQIPVKEYLENHILKGDQNNEA